MSRLSWKVLSLLLGVAAAARGAVPMQPEHLELLRKIDSAEISHDGRFVVYSVAINELEANRVRHEVRRISLPTGAPEVLAEGESPRFSPDGKQVAYLAPSQDKTGLFLYDLEAKKSELLVELEASDHFLGHEADRRFAWSPDGRSIAYLALEPGPAPTQPAPALAGVKVLERILYKTRTGFSPNRPLEVWLVATSGPARGQAKRLTEGAFDHHSLAWAPDGKRLLFSSNQAPDPDAHYADDLFWVDVASGALSRLTDTPGPELHPAVSPDGSKVAYLAMSRAISTRDSPAEDLQLWVMPSAGGTGVELSASLDRRVTEIAWEPGGDSLLFVAEDQGRKPIYRVKLPQGEAPATIERVLDGFFQASALSLDEKGKTVAYLKTDMTHPGEVFATQIKALRTGQVTQENRALMSLIKPANADTFWSTNADGTRVQTWLMKPLGFRPTERYPAVLWIHGGPHGMHGHAFTERLQLLAAHGYAVIFANPRGSAGYGQAFSDGSLNDWGGGDYRDLMAALEKTLSENPWIDQVRLGVAGWSYGGYMTNWMITQTDRFRAAVAGASVSNLVSFYGTSIYPDLIEAEFGDKPWEHFDLLWQRSPLAFVGKVVTPTLFLHGENDNDVPIGQAEEMFLALKKRGIAAQMVRYPGEGHSLALPAYRVDSFRRIFAWLDPILKPVPPPADLHQERSPPPAAPRKPLAIEPPASPPAPPAEPPPAEKPPASRPGSTGGGT